MDAEREVRVHVHFLVREKLFHSAQSAAAEGLRRFPRNVSLRLAAGACLVREGQTAEAVRELEALCEDAGVGQTLGPLITLAAAHEACAVPDHEALASVKERISEERPRTSEPGLYQAVFGQVLLGQYDAARDLSKKLVQMPSVTADSLAICGWAELLAENGDKEAALKLFDKALDAEDGRHTDAVIGKAQLLSVRREHDAAAALLDRLVVRGSLAALVERARCHLALYDWERFLETASRALSADASCPQALQFKALVALCRDGDCEAAALGLGRYLLELERSEPRGAALLLEASQLFSRSCGRAEAVLNETRRLVERAAQIRPGVDAACELARQSLLSGKTSEAVRHFRAAMRVDSSSVAALCGLCRCQLLEGETEQAARQIEFLREVSPSSEVLFMSAQVAASVGDIDLALKELDEAVDVHFRTLRPIPFGTSYLLALDPDFLLQLARQYILMSPPQPPEEGQQLSGPLKQALTILQPVCRSCPGLVEAHLLLAKVQLLGCDLEAASHALHHILDELDAASSPAHLLTAQVLIRQKDFDRAVQSLEMALSYDLHVREQPLYHLLTAHIQKEKGDIEESVKSLQTGIHLNCSQMSLSDQVSLSLELVDSLIATGDLEAAGRELSAATERFEAGPEGGRISLSRAQLLLAAGDVGGALRELDSVAPGKPYYRQAQCLAADIHLRRRGDRVAYADCFRRLVEHAPGPATFCMLGDAFMQLLDPDRALEAYEQALKRAPRDVALARKVGRTLVKAHQYGKAVSYYREAVRAEGSGELRLDLAELLTRLGQHDRAEKLLQQELTSPATSLDSGLEYKVRLLRQLSQVRERSGDTAGALATLREARDSQVRLCRRFPENSAVRAEAASLCRRAAELAAALGDHAAAVQLYRDALTDDPHDQTALVALAKLYMQAGELDQCQQACAALLEKDPNNEEAMVTMADLAFRRADFDAAAIHFRQLLGRLPMYWTALARLVEVCRRTAALPSAESFIERAATLCKRPEQEAGLCYCRGLFEWYSGRQDAALRYFNGARHDPEWGRQALCNMIEICLDQDDGGLEEASRDAALATAERLLAELKPRAGGLGSGEEALNHKLLGNFLLLASQQKSRVERALQDLTALASQEAYRDHAGLALGLARAYTQLKQTTRARNQLKRVARSPWRFEEADYLEQCWLALAEAQGVGSAGAAELVGRTLRHNRGCVRAHRLLALAAEGEQRYRDAASSYAVAWSLGGRMDPTIGSKLAFCHMKAKRYADAIDVCQQVLKLQPDFPRIRKEILEKCRNNLRT